MVTFRYYNSPLRLDIRCYSGQSSVKMVYECTIPEKNMSCILLLTYPTHISLIPLATTFNASRHIKSNVCGRCTHIFHEAAALCFMIAKTAVSTMPMPTRMIE
jgi:hypothetical protein